ncbi:MAG TPA: hypothetical protein VMI73_01425 [Trebonia sp.]|nr:hypothetical protein [Trebonia sp.]
MPGKGKTARYTAIARELDIPVPFDLVEFTARLERRRSRPILLRPFTAAAGMPSGLWIGTDTADYIYYEQGTTPFHRALIVLHEMAHMLLNHRGMGGWEGFASQLAPDVHPSLVRLILGRFGYAEPEERRGPGTQHRAGKCGRHRASGDLDLRGLAGGDRASFGSFL